MYLLGIRCFVFRNTKGNEVVDLQCNRNSLVYNSLEIEREKLKYFELIL